MQARRRCHVHRALATATEPWARMGVRALQRSAGIGSTRPSGKCRAWASSTKLAPASKAPALDSTSHQPGGGYEACRMEAQCPQPRKATADEVTQLGRESVTHSPSRAVRPHARSESRRLRGRPTSSCRSPCSTISAPDAAASCSQLRNFLSCSIGAAPCQSGTTRRAGITPWARHSAQSRRHRAHLGRGDIVDRDQQLHREQ